MVKIKKYFCLTFDLEEFDIPKSMTDNERYAISYEGAKCIVNLLSKENINATFFVTAEFALKYPQFIFDISKENEIASHGYSHTHEYKNFNEELTYNALMKSKEELEKITKKEVLGFRAPRMSSPSYRLLNKVGFKYDASLHPTYIPGRYNHFLKSRSIQVKDNVIVIPTSVTPLIRAPFTWYWFRNFGLVYAKACTRLASLNQNYVSIYFHPWEFADLEQYNIPYSVKKNTGEKLRKLLGNYIKWCKPKYEFITMKDMVKNYLKQ